MERLPRAELVGGNVIALLELLYTDAILLGDGVERLTCGDDVSCGRRLLLGFCLLSTGAAGGLLFFGDRSFLFAGGLASRRRASRCSVVGPFEVHTQLRRIHFAPSAVKLEDGREGETYGIGHIVPWDDATAELWVERRD